MKCDRDQRNKQHTKDYRTGEHTVAAVNDGILLYQSLTPLLSFNLSTHSSLSIRLSPTHSVNSLLSTHLPNYRPYSSNHPTIHLCTHAHIHAHEHTNTHTHMYILYRPLHILYSRSALACLQGPDWTGSASE